MHAWFCYVKWLEIIILTEFSLVCDVKINQWKYSLNCHVLSCSLNITLSNKMDRGRHKISKASLVYNALRDKRNVSETGSLRVRDMK